jgi:hypothetical protein
MAIDSIRTATPWRFCSVILVLAVLGGCVTRSQRSYLPDPRAARLTPDDWRERASTLLEAECPRVMGTGTAALGEAGFTVVLGANGAVREAILTRSSGDERIDALFGGLTAQLRFSRSSDGDRAPIVAGYSCARNASAATLELNTTP